MTTNEINTVPDASIARDATTEVAPAPARVFVALNNNEVLSGTVKRPFIQGNKLLGAVLSFEGRDETALLHLKQMVGANKEERLSSMKLGDSVRVKLIVSGERPNRKTWASEIALGDEAIVEQILAGERKAVPGRVINTADYGIFVELLGSAAAGRRGLIHAKNFGGSAPASLKDFTVFTPGQPITVDVLDARIDSKNVLRVDLRLSEAAA